MNVPARVNGTAFWTWSPWVLAALTAITAAMLLLARGPEITLAASYGRALADVDTSWMPAPSENIWLSRTDSQPMALRRALAPGDHISIIRGGRAEEIEVTGLEQIDGEGFGLAGLKIQVVTGRPKESGAGERVRFLFAIDGPEAAPAILPGRVL